MHRQFTPASSRLGAITALTLATRGAGATHSKFGMDGYSNLTFNNAADGLLEELESRIEAADSDAVEDVSLSDGVLTVDTKSGSFVLNKQAPKAQLWLSSPISGPHHYDMTAGATENDFRQWTSDRDGHLLVTLLERELTQTFGKSFVFQHE